MIIASKALNRSSTLKHSDKGRLTFYEVEKHFTVQQQPNVITFVKNKCFMAAALIEDCSHYLVLSVFAGADTVLKSCMFLIDFYCMAIK